MRVYISHYFTIFRLRQSNWIILVFIHTWASKRSAHKVTLEFFLRYFIHRDKIWRVFFMIGFDEVSTIDFLTLPWLYIIPKLFARLKDLWISNAQNFTIFSSSSFIAHLVGALIQNLGVSGSILAESSIMFLNVIWNLH